MIAEFDTAFSHYQIDDVMYSGRPARVLYSDTVKMVAQSGTPRDGSITPLFDYNQRFREIVRGTKPKRVLILGGGVFTLPSVLIREDRRLRLDVVELDGELVAIAEQYFGYKANRRMGIYVGDGSKYIVETDQQYDMIIIDAFSDSEIPQSFQTDAFVRQLALRCNKHGIVAINVIASLQGLGSLVLRRLYDLLRVAFPKVQIFPASRDYSLWMSQNYIMVAQDGSWDVSPFLVRSSVSLPKAAFNLKH